MYDDRINFLEKDRVHFIQIRDDARGHKEYFVEAEENAIQAIESINRMIAHYRRMEEQSGIFGQPALLLDAGEVAKAMAEATAKISSNGHLDAADIYDRLLDSFHVDQKFRSIGEIVKEFQAAGYSVKRDNIRRALRAALRDRNLVRLSYRSSKKFVWYGLPKWVNRQENNSATFVDKSVMPESAKMLKTRTPHFTAQYE